MGKDKPTEAAPVIRQDLGKLEVAEDVFRDIFRQAIVGVPGVASVARGPSGIFGIGGGDDGIRIERGGGGEVAFSVSLTVRYDVNIPHLVAELRQRTTNAVEEATGYNVRAVNVTIEHILPPEPVKPEPAEPEAVNVPEMPPVPDPDKE